MDPSEAHLRMRRRDRWSLQVRLWRAWRAGVAERRAVALGTVRGAVLGGLVASIDADGGGALAEAELHLLDGTCLCLGRCHAPTLGRLRAALAAGPVRVERLADHRHCWGVYLSTAGGRLGVLAPRLAVAGAGGGLRTVPVRPLAPA